MEIKAPRKDGKTKKAITIDHSLMFSLVFYDSNFVSLFPI